MELMGKKGRSLKNVYPEQKELTQAEAIAHMSLALWAVAVCRAREMIAISTNIENMVQRGLRLGKLQHLLDKFSKLPAVRHKTTQALRELFCGHCVLIQGEPERLLIKADLCIFTHHVCAGKDLIKLYIGL